ncbi:hypothetical protein, partial [Halomarina oriensis]
PLAKESAYDIDGLTERLDQLTDLVGARRPDEVDYIGVLPADRNGLDRRLEQLVEDRALDVETTDSEVIIR